VNYLIVKNWREHQHYTKRNPPWIKLHRAIIDDYAFAALKDKTKAHLMLIWVLAAGMEGRIPHDAKFIASRISAIEPVDLDAMVEAGFLLNDGAEPDAPVAQNDAAAKNAEYRKQAEEVIAFLNEKAGRKFDLNGANAGHVIARLRDGETVEDMRSIIARKCRDWRGDEKMNKFLRPETLFNRTKYASYKGELVVGQ
jgi:uncharacterized phage protein (TIGR02220 family)